jgi:hypothetical protein
MRDERPSAELRVVEAGAHFHINGMTWAGAPLSRISAYDTETRSMLQTPQRFPRAGSQSYPTPAATADSDGSTTVTFGPQRPADSPECNWIQTTEGKGWFPILRLYSPLAPFFDKSWRPSEIELLD